YLGSIARPSAPIPRVHVEEPVRTEPKRVTEKGANVPLPAIAYTWLGPAAAHVPLARLPPGDRAGRERLPRCAAGSRAVRRHRHAGQRQDVRPCAESN